LSGDGTGACERFRLNPKTKKHLQGEYNAARLALRRARLPEDKAERRKKIHQAEEVAWRAIAL
jgi:hypothetical protein